MGPAPREADDDAPPETIVVGSAVLRKETEHDAEAVGRAIALNLDRLAPWMSWAVPETAFVDAQRTRIVASGQRWDARLEFDYVLVDAETDAILGKCSLMKRGDPCAIELGYWLTRDAVGHGCMTDAARALTTAALGLRGIDRVEIHCDAANVRSAAIPSRLGYRIDRIDDHPITTPSQTGRQMVWVFPA